MRPKLKRTTKLARTLLALEVLVATLVALLGHGCGPAVDQGCHGQTCLRGVAGARAADRLARVADEAPRAPDREALLADALVGTHEGAETELGGRMQVRALHLPHVGAGANARFTLDSGKRGWITAMPAEELLTSAAFADGKVFLGGGFSSHTMFALDAYSGEMVWALAAPDGGPSAAIVEKSSVIFNTESCTIFVADAETGVLRWKRYLGDPLMSQPVADEHFVYSAYPANGAHLFGAFALADGNPGWTVPIPADVIQAPTLVGGALYFATMDGTAWRVRARDGNVDWSRDVRAASAPAVANGHVLLSRRVDGSGATREQAIVLSARDGATTAEAESVPAPYFLGQSRDRALASGQGGAWGSVPHGEHLGLANVTSGWAYQGATPVVADGRAYYAMAGTLRARDVATGRTVWHRDYAGGADAQAISPPAVANGVLFFGTVDGHVYGTDVDTGMTLYAWNVGEPVVFQPVIAQGWLYVSTGKGHVVGLELGDPRLDGWHMWGGNAAHTGLVETAGDVDPHLLASLARPSRGELRLAKLESPEPAAAAAAAPGSAPASAPAPAPESATGDATSSSDPDPDAPQADGDVLRARTRPEMPLLPLSGTDVRARVSGDVARVTVTQHFVNPNDRPIEAVYLFPLPAEAAVDGMEMHIGDRVVRARIHERTEAQHIYTEARAAGRRAALLEQERADLFATRVANIPPHQQIDVELRYVVELPFEAGRYELGFPMAYPHHYDPAHATEAPVARAGAEAPVTLEVELDAGMPVRELASPSHAVRVERHGDDAAKVTLSDPAHASDHDFTLRWTTSGAEPQAAVLATRDERSGYFSLVLQPPAAPGDTQTASRDVTFVVDTSSSMHGAPLAQAKAVMHGVLGTLRGTDTFQVLAFADGVTRLADAPLAVSAESVARAGTFVDGLSAAGATEMGPALAAALDGTHPVEGRVPMVVLVTDGYIGNEADVLRAMASRLGTTRVWTLGVGASPNRFLLDRAAELGRGRSLVASLSDDPARLASRFAELSDRPVFTDVEVDWGGLPVADVYPRRVPDLFASKPVVLHGRYTRGATGVVRIRGTIGTQRYERTVNVTLPGAIVQDDVHAAQRTLWARTAIGDRLARLTLRDDATLAHEVRDLGLRYAIVTPYTSFVAVDTTPVPADAATPGDDQRATLSPGRALPGDPEIRVRAPSDARAVTFLLPFGDTVSATWDAALEVWTGRFLIPRDAEDGSYPVIIEITRADGTTERMQLWYTVDSAAPMVALTVDGVAHPGGTVVVHAHQVVTSADLEQLGQHARDRLGHGTVTSAEILGDANRVELALPWSDEVIEMTQGTPGDWSATVRIPDGASGSVSLGVTAVDLAANVRRQSLHVAVSP